MKGSSNILFMYRSKYLIQETLASNKEALIVQLADLVLLRVTESVEQSTCSFECQHSKKRRVRDGRSTDYAEGSPNRFDSLEHQKLPTCQPLKDKTKYSIYSYVIQKLYQNVPRTKDYLSSATVVEQLGKQLIKWCLSGVFHIWSL